VSTRQFLVSIDNPEDRVSGRTSSKSWCFDLCGGFRICLNSETFLVILQLIGYLLLVAVIIVPDISVILYGGILLFVILLSD
jgi:hypothetical protein